MTFKIKSNVKLALHIKAKESHITLSEQTYVIKGDKTRDVGKPLELLGFTMMTITKATFCISESPKKCSEASFDLSEPQRLLVPDGHHSMLVNPDMSRCRGFGGMGWSSTVFYVPGYNQTFIPGVLYLQ